jgi:hypothetical protein
LEEDMLNFAEVIQTIKSWGDEIRTAFGAAVEAWANGEAKSFTEFANDVADRLSQTARAVADKATAARDAAQAAGNPEAAAVYESRANAYSALADARATMGAEEYAARTNATIVDGLGRIVGGSVDAVQLAQAYDA